MSFETIIAHSVEEIGPENWDRLSGGRPFSSYGWYRLGERVLTGSSPVYVILHENGEAIARATLWVTPDEPLPVPAGPLRRGLAATLRRWPLLICRAPLADAPGLILPDAPRRAPALAALAAAARELLRQTGCSYLLFDYLDGEQSAWREWPAWLLPSSVADPGTRLDLSWADFDAYLMALSQVTRRNVRRHLREFEALGARVELLDHVPALDTALPLIRAVDERHATMSKPWARALLENLSGTPFAWIEARLEGRLAGCGLVLADGPACMSTLLGLDYSLPHMPIYAGVIYASIRAAIQLGAGFLRGGSGAYEFKRRLKFQPEDNNHILLSGRGGLTHQVARLATASWV